MISARVVHRSWTSGSLIRINIPLHPYYIYYTVIFKSYYTVSICSTIIKRCRDESKMGAEMQRKYRRTNIFIIDEDLWAWAQYRAKLLGYRSVSEYIFELIKANKEKQD